MTRKVTIKDIARESGVSIATVSYVLNGREDKRISEETKNKVLHIANLYNYSRSFSALHISTGRTKIVALYVYSNDFALNYAEKYRFVSVLITALEKEGYSLRIMNYGKAQRIDNVDAIVCCDTPTEFFFEVAHVNFVPVLSYNNYVGDGLFYQINTDYHVAKQYAVSQFGTEDFLTASLAVGNAERKEAMLKEFPQTQFLCNFDGARKMVAEVGEKPLLVFETSLYDYLKPLCNNLLIYVPYKQKIATLVQKMKEVIDRQDVVGYDIRI